MFSEGDIADPNVERGYQRVATVGFQPFFVLSQSGFLRFSANEQRRSKARHHELRLGGAPEARCSRKGTLQAQVPNPSFFFFI